jgi:hypothetical protein
MDASTDQRVCRPRSYRTAWIGSPKAKRTPAKVESNNPMICMSIYLNPQRCREGVFVSDFWSVAYLTQPFGECWQYNGSNRECFPCRFTTGCAVP